MKICYLILAHNNSNHFKNLIEAISTENTEIFVHLDKKSNIEGFQTQLAGHNNVVFTKERISVGWGRFSMVQATLNLLKQAFFSENKHDYYCFLSGSDYPLKSPIYIENYLQDCDGKEFINIVKIPNRKARKSLARINKYHFNFEFLSNKAFFNLMKLQKKFKIPNIPRPYQHIFQNRELYAGSQWWTLTHSAVEYILKFIEANPKFVRFFKNTQIPDESFFQMIIGNSQFSEKVTRNLTYSHWVYGQSPAIITDAYIDRAIENGGAFAGNDDPYGSGPLLFARKFPDNSDTLIQTIQKNLW